MAKGFLKGALHAERFDDIEKCIQDVETAVIDLKIVYTNFRYGSVAKIIDKLEHVADFIKKSKMVYKTALTFKLIGKSFSKWLLSLRVSHDFPMLS